MNNKIEWQNTVGLALEAQSICELIKDSASENPKTEKYADAASTITKKIQDVLKYLDKNEHLNCAQIYPCHKHIFYRYNEKTPARSEGLNKEALGRKFGDRNPRTPHTNL